MSSAIAGLAVGAGALVLWNVSLAGAIARTPARDRLFRTVSALAGLLLIPGLLVAAAAGSALTSHVAGGIWWFWPLVVSLFAVQAVWAVGARLATPVVGLPIALWNVALAVGTWASALTNHGIAPVVNGEWAEGALRLALAGLAGPAALVSPFALWLPALGPAYPARWGLSAAARGTVAVVCAGALALTAWSAPRVRALQLSFVRFGDDRLTEHPLGDFATGLAVLPPLDHPAAPDALRNDLALADSMEADLLFVEIAPTVRAGALDSLARALEGPRRDSARFALAPAIGGDAPAGPERERMLVALERATRRLQPDLVLAEPGATAGRGSDAGRRRWFEQVRTATRRGGSAAHVLPLVRPILADRGWFAWADSAAGGVVFVFDATRGGDVLANELATARAWISAPARTADPARVAWALGPRTAPLALGEGAQALALWGMLSWATRSPGVSGAIAGPSADYETITGLRDAGGRIRPAGRTMTRASRALHATAR